MSQLSLHDQKAAEAPPVIRSSQGTVHSQEMVRCYFVFILEGKENTPKGSPVDRHPLMSYCPAFHQMTKPKPHTSRVELTMTGLNNRGVSPGAREESRWSCGSQRKWQESRSVTSQQSQLHGRICGIFTTKCVDF